MPKISTNKFRFRKHERLGAEGAEEDEDFLFDCFIDTGDLKVLQDTEASNRIVLGRTGTGKTALLMMLRQTEQNVAWINPDQLSLRYLTNSTILQYLDELGVRLDIFYRLLWRHIFAVELIKLKYHVKNEEEQNSFLDKISRLFGRDKQKEQAMAYLVEWGKKFWEGTECRVHEVTDKLERDVKAELGAKAGVLSAGAADVSKISTEDKKEIVHRAQSIVNQVQVQKLAQIIDCLGKDVFADPKQKYYVVIDGLDDDWVDDRIRFKLIRALIEAVRDFQKIRHAKIVIAIRKDLLDRVFRETRDSGFQEEKYQSLFLRLQWTPSQLIEILDSRIRKLVRRQYTKADVGWRDIFPSKVDKRETRDWIIDRTLHRPRDLLAFANCAIEMACDRSEVTVSLLRDAESRYSNLRYRSIGDEWATDYPELLTAANLLKRRPKHIPLSEFSDTDFENVCVQVSEDSGTQDQGRISGWAMEIAQSRLSIQDFKFRLLRVFYHVGFIGIKRDRKMKTSWAFQDRELLKDAEITDSAVIEICPMFYRIFGTELYSRD